MLIKLLHNYIQSYIYKYGLLLCLQAYYWVDDSPVLFTLLGQLSSLDRNVRATGQNFISEVPIQHNSAENRHNKLVDIASSKRLYLQRLSSFQNRLKQLNRSCVALFVTPVSDPVWLQIECLHPFEKNWFLCEHRVVPINLNQT